MDAARCTLAIAHDGDHEALASGVKWAAETVQSIRGPLAFGRTDGGTPDTAPEGRFGTTLDARPVALMGWEARRTSRREAGPRSDRLRAGTWHRGPPMRAPP